MRKFRLKNFLELDSTLAEVLQWQVQINKLFIFDTLR